MKAQMFIITMVFLVGLVFAVQTSLSQYSFIDLADSFKDNQGELYTSVITSFESTLLSPDCPAARVHKNELEQFMEGRVIGGTTIDVDATLDCAEWGNQPLQLAVTIRNAENDIHDDVALPRA